MYDGQRTDLSFFGTDDAVLMSSGKYYPGSDPGASHRRTTQEVDMTTTGTVKFFNEQKGFGFITSPDSDDVFVHVSNIVGGGTLTEGQSVEYETAPGRKGPEAVNVKAV